LKTSIRKLLLLVYFSSVPSLAYAQQGRSISVPASAHDQVQDCLRELWGKPVFWDRNADAPVDPSVCKAEPAKMEQALKEQHLITFRLSNAVLLVQEGSFDKNYANSNYKWKTPEIIIRVLPTDRSNPGSRPPTETELHEVGDTVLRRSHLPPLNCPYVASEGQVGRTALSIFVEIHRLHVNSEQESAVARVVASDPEPDRTTSEGRIVYGELQGGHFQYLWESPLLGGGNLNPYFRDLLHNGNRQINVLSEIGMSKPEYNRLYAFYAFDLDGTEISRQPSTCKFYGDLARHSATACPIQDSDEKVHYIIRDGRYREVLGPEPAGQDVRDAVEGRKLNEEGMQLMKAGNYAEAAERFIDALEKKPDSILFATNAGFACYKIGRYEEALSYIKAFTELSNHPIAYLNLGDILVKLNRFAEARDAYMEYLASGPSPSSAADVKKKLDALPLSP